MTTARRRLSVAETGGSLATSERRARRALGFNRSGVHSSRIIGDERRALVRRIEELAVAHPRYGSRRIWALLRSEGWSLNKNATQMICRQKCYPPNLLRPTSDRSDDRGAGSELDGRRILR